MTTVPEPLDVLTLGETMALLVAQEPGPLEQVQTFSKRLAGADSNVAIGLARLGFKVGWVSRLGADSFGRYVRQAIEAEGVDTSQVAVDPNRSTGFMLKSCSLDGSDPEQDLLQVGGVDPGHEPAAAHQVGDRLLDRRALERFVASPATLARSSSWLWVLGVLEIWYRIFCEPDGKSFASCNLLETAAGRR